MSTQAGSANPVVDSDRVSAPVVDARLLGDKPHGSGRGESTLSQSIETSPVVGNLAREGNGKATGEGREAAGGLGVFNPETTPSSADSVKERSLGAARLLEAWKRIQIQEKQEENLLEKIRQKLDQMDNVVSNAKNIHKVVKNDMAVVMSCMSRLEKGREKSGKDKESFELLLNSLQHQMLSAQTTVTGTLRTPKRKERSPSASENRSKKKKGSENLAAATQRRQVPNEVQASSYPAIPGTSQDAEADWEVARVRTRKKGGQVKERQQRTRAKPDAILVKRKDQNATFASVLKLMKEKVDQNEVGDRVNKIKQTKSGDLLLQLQKGSNVKEVKDVIAAAIGTETTVLQLSQLITLDIRDIDGDTSNEEVQAALVSALNLPKEEVKVKAIRPAFGGTQMALVTMARAAALPLINEGKVRIGWVKARVRERVTVPRCFSCLGFGHTSAKCTQRSNEKLCFLCGCKDHLAASCKNQPKCIQCEAIGQPHNHRSGSSTCGALAKAKKKILGTRND